MPTYTTGVTHFTSPLIEPLLKAAERAGLKSSDRYIFITPDFIDFREAGRFTMAEVGYWVGESKPGKGAYRRGIGFAHRMLGDKPNKEIGRAIALTRAMKDSLSPEAA